MKQIIRKWLSIALCFSILSAANGPYGQASIPPAAQDSQSPQSIDGLLKKSYLELLQQAPTVRFTGKQFEEVRKRLEKEEKTKKDELKTKQKNQENQIREAQVELRKLNLTSPEDSSEMSEQRHDLHCRIQSLQTQLADTKVALQNGIPVEYDNLRAKLELLEKWPAAQREIQSEIASGKVRSRRWGDVQDIGFRTIERNQEDDIKDGQEAVQQMKQMGMMPKALEDEVVVEYVNRLAQNIARNSDLKVPLQVTVLNSKEINAFALPGGFLFINRGLILETQNEAQLAGVLAHEISHDVARHGHRLMKKATIANLLYQGAQIAAMIFTGGAVGLGTYYALQYGFYGLGLALSLQLLGVSRDYEMEADILGVQYVWKAGYSTEGFIQFFDVMASKEGYVEKTSFFRTHPAFYDRIVGVYREISFLPKQESAIESTSEFQAIQSRLRDIVKKLDEEEADRPSLYKQEPGCPGEPSELNKPVLERRN
ncbi:MAG: M48 family metalloprotease [Acidobacteria bacterium]|nr:M48 family metalloprotease [Acidobacteriota bacterium]